MPATLTRRGVLTRVGPLVLFGGCLGGSDDATVESPNSTRTASTERRTTPTPRCAVEADSPTSEFGPPYPPLSSVDSPALAMDFAFTFEEALQRNRVRILEPRVSYVRLESKDATEVKSVTRGYLVGVRLEVGFGREVHTSTDPDAESFHEQRTSCAAYFVGDRALRVGTESLTVVDPRASPDGEVVACEE